MPSLLKFENVMSLASECVSAVLKLLAEVEVVDGSYRLLLPIKPGFEPLLFQRLWIMSMFETLMSEMFLDAQPNCTIGAVDSFCTTTLLTVTLE